MKQNAARENIVIDAETRSKLEQQLRELRHQLRDTEVTLDEVTLEKIAVEQHLYDAKRALKEEEQVIP